MKKLFVAAALAVTLAQPALAITFSKLTTIYVGSGVYDDAGATDVGTATSIHCSNVSGVATQVRVLILNNNGGIAGSLIQTLAHGATVTFSTHQTFIFVDGSSSLAVAGGVAQGVVNVEATNSAVFCTGHIVDAAGNPPAFMGDLHLVRVNPHPGTVE
jgi:hypothetical protein